MSRLFRCLALLLPFLVLQAQAASLPDGDARALGFDPAALSAVDRSVQAKIDEGAFPGATLLIVRDGKVAHQSLLGRRAPGGAPMTGDTLFRIYSMTKPIVSVAALALVEQGKLDLDQSLSDLIPAFAATRVATGALDADGAPETEPAERPITILDLMRHTSGLTYGFFGQGVVRDAYRKAAAGNAGLSNVETAARLADLPLEHQPGTTWEYSRATDVLGAVVEIASGKPLGQALADMIFAPLGMHDTSFGIADAVDYPRIAEPHESDSRIGSFGMFDPRITGKAPSGGGGLMSTTDDYARFAQMLLNGGELDGVRILKPETVAMMTQDQTISRGMKPGKYYLPGRGYGFGLGVAVRIADEGAARPGTLGDYFWGGAGGTYYFADPAQGIFVLFMIQAPKAGRTMRGAVRAQVYEAMTRR
ncbi:MAG: serine hydrolase [Minwuia sp.]|nr:serine hydrolase [Minwuia sp.]